MISVIDYGAGNLCSVLNALEELGEEAEVVSEGAALAEAERIILPGVGAMASAMTRLKAAGLDAAVQDAVAERGVPFLGICLGMQMMCTLSREGGAATPGFGWVAGEVVALEPDPPARLVPHIGWAEIAPSNGHPLFDGIAPGTAFYFCHSFHAALTDRTPETAALDLGGPLVTVAIERGNAVGVQFHPERSGNAGLRLIENFLDWDGAGSA